ncbi:MAG: hypothetical protein KAH56_10115 [Candidatus Krumholzibacteria bacterium]|nr:hypothetical protein [Candidatus Krumholzibacteria bacterium]
MAERNRLQTLAGTLLVAALVLVFLVPAALAQTDQEPTNEPETQSDQTVSQATTPPPPPPKKGPDAGPFSKGKVRVGFYGGAGSTYNQTYVILGAGVGYYLLNGLEAGVDVEGWILQDPTFWKVTPQVRYVMWKMKSFKPYIGAFWRKTFVTGDNPLHIPDYDSYGGRVGIAMNKGRSYLAVGAVYEKFNDDVFSGDTDTWYPEIAFWISF